MAEKHIPNTYEGEYWDDDLPQVPFEYKVDENEVQNQIEKLNNLHITGNDTVLLDGEIPTTENQSGCNISYQPVPPEASSQSDSLSDYNSREERPYYYAQTHPRKVYVSNINFKTTTNVLSNFLEEKFGNIEYCKIVRDQKNRSKGRGFVRFWDVDSVQKILAYEGDLTLDKRVLNIQMATRKKYIEDEKSCETEDKKNCESATPQIIETQESTVDGNVDKNENISHYTIECLDDNTLMTVFSMLELRDRLTCRTVCKRWRSIAMKLWQSMTELSFSFLSYKSKFSDIVFRKLLQPGLPVLHTLDLSSVGRFLTVNVINFVCKYCPALKRIDVTNMNLNHRVLKTFSENFSELESFTLCHSSDVGDKTLFTIFRNCRKLNYVNLEGNWRLTGKCFQITLSSIRTLVLSNCSQLSEEGAKKIAQGCASVIELYLSGCKNLTNAGLEAIINSCQRVKILELKGPFDSLTNTIFSSIPKLSDLEKVDLSGNNSLDDNALRSIASSCKLLKNLNIQQCHENITHEGIAVLANCENLEYLNLSYVINTTDESLQALASVGHMTHILLRGCSIITAAGVTPFIQHCPKLELLDISGCQYVNDVMFDCLVDGNYADHSHKLEIVVGGTAIADIPELVPECVHINRLNYCAFHLRPDREYIELDDDYDDVYEDFNDIDEEYDYYDEDYDDYLHNDDPLFEERFNLS